MLTGFRTTPSWAPLSELKILDWQSDENFVRAVPTIGNFIVLYFGLIKYVTNSGTYTNDASTLYNSSQRKEEATLKVKLKFSVISSLEPARFCLAVTERLVATGTRWYS